MRVSYFWFSGVYSEYLLKRVCQTKITSSSLEQQLETRHRSAVMTEY